MRAVGLLQVGIETDTQMCEVVVVGVGKERRDDVLYRMSQRMRKLGNLDHDVAGLLSHSQADHDHLALD